MSNKYSAVLFDYDGTLADTTEENFKGWQWAFSELGVTLDRRQYFLMEGYKIRVIAEKLLSTAGRDLSLALHMVERREQYAREGHSPRLFAQALPLIADLRARGVKCAMASAASRERLQHPALSELRGALDALISGDDCKIGKPDPEPYLLAARSVGVAIDRCVVVENAPAGIASAKSAGMLCAAICSTLSADDLSQADQIFENLAECADWLKQQAEGCQ